MVNTKDEPGNRQKDKVKQMNDLPRCKISNITETEPAAMDFKPFTEEKRLPENEAQTILLTLSDGRVIIAVTSPFHKDDDPKVNIEKIEVSQPYFLCRGFGWSGPMCIYPKEGDDKNST